MAHTVRGSDTRFSDIIRELGLLPTFARVRVHIMKGIAFLDEVPVEHLHQRVGPGEHTVRLGKQKKPVSFVVEHTTA